MNKIITEAQKHEIEDLAIEHYEALIAFGADMYREGLIKGGILVIAGAVIGLTIDCAVKTFKNKPNKDEES